MAEPLSAIALGANLGDPVSTFKQAVRQIAALPKTRVKSHSSFYQSKAVGPAQADYVNAAILIQTGLAPMPLLESLQAIEDRLGRRRGVVRWGPRLIDLDIITYGQSIVRRPNLIIPHPRAHRRCFVLAPLAEINPKLRLPNLGTVSELLASCGSGAATPIAGRPDPEVWA